MRRENNRTEPSGNAAERQLDREVDQPGRGRKSVCQDEIDAVRSDQRELAPEQIRLSKKADGASLSFDSLPRAKIRCQATEPPIKHPIRTFLVDNHPVVVAGARALIEAADDIVCVGEAYSGTDALAKIEEATPDVVVLEARLPDMDGLVLAKQLVAGGFRGHIVVMTLYESRSYVERALQVGAKGFVQKRSACLNLLFAIRTAMLGGLYFDPPTASEMLTPPDPERDDRISAGDFGLTEREQEVLRLIALGFCHKEIAYRVAVSVKSVETYKLRATQKLNLHSRAQIVQFAVTHGWMQASNAEA
jgi:DNA-binding NarL/FixJ family response regulator